MISPIELTITPRQRDIGGFAVRRALPDAHRQMVGPFIFFDHMGPAEFAPGRGLDVRPHPHINLATVTYLFEGEILHRDSLGYVQPIQPGAVNWMTAGRGIAHSERSSPESRAAAQKLHGIQSWVALPAEAEEREPCFVHHPADSLPSLERAGCRLRVIAGRAFGATSPVEVFSPMFYVEARLAAGSELAMPDEYRERALYVVEGSVAAGGDSLGAGTLGVLRNGENTVLRAISDAHVMLFGGEPLGHRFIWWNFVSSRRERIEEAKDAWRNGAFDPVPDEVDFIPLPEG